MPSLALLFPLCTVGAPSQFALVLVGSNCLILQQVLRETRIDLRCYATAEIHNVLGSVAKAVITETRIPAPSD